MKKAKKDSVMTGYALERKLFDTVERYATETKMSRTGIVEVALAEYFKNKDIEVYADPITE